MAHEYDIAVGANIRQWRHVRGITQQQLGEMVGIKFQQIQKYETGANRVSASRLIMICKALDAGILDMFAGIDGISERGDLDEIMVKADKYDSMAAAFHNSGVALAS